MDKLGIEPSLLAAQIINVLIIIFVLHRLLYKPILTMLARRKQEIEEGLALTEKLREEEEKWQQKRAKLLEEVRREGQLIIAAATKEAKEQEKEILAQAHEEAKSIIVKGRAEVGRLREEMEKDLKKDAVKLAVAMAKRLLANAVSTEMAHTLIKKHLKQLEEV